MGKSLHPKVKEFKEFVRENPKIARDVRNGQANWQDLFEDWYLLGEEDTRWDQYKEGNSKSNVNSISSEGKKSGWMDQVGEMVKKMDANQLQQHINSLSEALGAVQGVLSQFQSNNRGTTDKNETPSKPSHPFSFRKD
ncbi:YlbD family protein [Rossellomorea aquimaris]|uniref:YlbD family protein n=1 Tax=Rossellomorea aquimaris TaxID=189382 RepID=UPI0007D0B5FB|nr:YlbD family protein [Rossellomorea aquimaris]